MHTSTDDTMAALLSVCFNVYTLIISAVALLLLNWSFKKPKNLPPGPWSLPLIGCIPSLAYTMYRSRDINPEQMLAKMAKQYGEVFCLKIGPKVIVVANGYKTVSEAFKNPLLNDRPSSRASVETGLSSGLGQASGKSWSTQRKITLNIFRKFGVGRNSFEGPILKEVQQLLELMCANKNSPFDPHILIGNCVANVTSVFVFGKRYDHADPEFEHILDSFSKILTIPGAGCITSMVPILRYFFLKQYNELKSVASDINELTESIINEHKDIFEEMNNNHDNVHKDFIDSFLHEIELNKDNESSQYINQQSLISTCVTMFIAGTETTTSTLRWALLLMMIYPDVQEKVQKELDDVIGRDRMPQWADRRDLPYTESVLLEVQRVRTIAPLGVPHCAAEDTTLAGYDIPKNAFVVSNIWAVHNDPNLWPEPDQFKPERFMDDDGKCNTREELIPFSTGRRICPGDNMAKMELFIFFSHMLHRFSIRETSPGHCSSLKGITGISHYPESYEIIAEIRD